MELAKFHCSICGGDGMLLYCHLSPLGCVEKTTIIFPIVVLCEGLKPETCYDYLQQPSCLDEQVCVAVKHLV